ncbi:MAG: hypothetical protein NTW86_28395 [Candidatus Sumerlaeota bacterium]|nr:hypothetical protein [Candidatus Sumerlaeota bacterium]
MRTYRSQAVPLLLAAVLAAAAARSTVGAAPRSALGPRFMPSSEIEPGMKLTGKTCFEGSQIEEFTGVVLGVERGAFAGGNLIWARLESPRFGPHGVAAGMSGSPCYIDGRLIGAVAYGMSMAQKPIAGITPIESMLRVLDLTNDKPHPEEEEENAGESTVGVWTIEELKDMARNSRPPGSSPLRVSVDDLPEALRNDAGPAAGDVELRPLAMPVAISACSPNVYGPLARKLAEFGMELIPGGMGGGTLDGAALPPLEPGSALGIPYLTGDLTLGGYGTVTFRDGARLIAFGHPAQGWGNSDMPFSPCSMFAVNASYGMTSKIGEVATPTGSIRQDREFGIGGVIGMMPRTFPMRVRVRSTQPALDREFRFQVWDNRYLTPLLVSVGVAEAVSAADRGDGDATLRGSYSIGIEGAAPIEKNLFYATSRGPSSTVELSLDEDFTLLLRNPFRKARIVSLEADLTVSDRARQTAIVSVTADKDVYRPGETVRLSLYLQPYRAPREKRLIEMPLSAELPDGQYDLYVVDAETRLRLERDRAPGLFTPMNYDQLVQAIRSHYVGNDLYVMLRERDEGVTVHGQELPTLPPSVRSTLSDSSERAFIRAISARVLAERVVEGESEFVGSARLPLRVSQTGQRMEEME